MLDLYHWIHSPEIRSYLLSNYDLSMEETVRIVCGGVRSLEEKYQALGVLHKEASTQKERGLVQSLLRLYDWAFEELRSERPGQVFIFMEYKGSTPDKVLEASFGGIDQVFHSFADLQECLKEYGGLYFNQFRTATIEKWVPINGKMQQVIQLHICVDHGNAFADRFDIPWKQYESLEICFDARTANTGNYRTTIPLPFQNGDLVRIDIPQLHEPMHGVLRVYDALGRYMSLTYIEDRCLKNLEMSYQDIGALSGWRVIDWTHPIEASDLPAGHELLAEISNYMRRTADHDALAMQNLIDCIYSTTIYRTPVTLEALLRDEKSGNLTCGDIFFEES